MARIRMQGLEELEIQLSKLGTKSVDVGKKMVYAGSKVVANEIKRGLKSLPEDKFRYLHGDDKFSGVPKEQKKDLENSFGVTFIDIDNKGNTNAKVGFDGYGSFKTKKYPKGVPNQLLARAIESGSSARKKTPFVRKATNRSKNKAVEEMEKVLNEEIENIMRGD